MKTAAIAVMTLAMITASANARLGETPRQMSSGKPIKVQSIKGRVAMTWKWKTTYQVGVFEANRAIIESFWLEGHSRPTNAQINLWMKPYRKLVSVNDGTDGRNTFTRFFDSSNKRIAVSVFDTNLNTLTVWSSEDFASRWPTKEREFAQNKAPQSAPPEREPGESWGDRALRGSQQQPQTTASVRAGLGATPSQMEPGRPYAITPDIDGRTLSYMWLVRYPAFENKQLWHTGDFDKATGHAVSESFWFEDKHVMTPEEREILLRPYAAFNRRAASYTRYNAEVKDINEITGVPNVEYKRPEHDEHSNYETFDLVAYDGSPIAMVMYDKVGNYLLIQKPPPQSKPQPTPEDENDCVIVATKHLNELGKSVPWKKMLMFVYIVDGKREALGHAVAVFKRSNDGNVWVNDKSGSDELATTSTDANEILRVLGEKYSSRLHKQVTLIGEFDKGS